jgi:hypothetical protein
MLSALMRAVLIPVGSQLGSLTEGLDPTTIPEWHIEANHCESPRRPLCLHRHSCQCVPLIVSHLSRARSWACAALVCVSSLSRSSNCVQTCTNNALLTHTDNDECAPDSPFASLNRHGSDFNVLDSPDSPYGYHSTRLTPWGASDLGLSNLNGY